jgi:hypothetical protein
MKMRAVALSAFLAVALAGSAVAALGARDPAALVLREGDFPTNVQYTWGDLPASAIQAMKRLGLQARGAYFAGTIPGSSGKSEVVSGAVYSFGDAGQATKAYAAFKSSLGSGAKLSLPPAGDEQIALYKQGSSVANMVVRRNSVVWELTVEGMGLIIPQEKIRTEMAKYAKAQKGRVGAG